MILSQSSAQSVASLSGPAETETKRIVSHRGSASGIDPPRSSSEAEPRLLKKNPTERKYTSYLLAGCDPGYWPVISLFSLVEIALVNRSIPARSNRRCFQRAELSATYLADETPFGKRWIFQDVHSGGAASNAGIEPGDILLSVDGQEITPPEHPVFAMGKQTGLEVVGRDDQVRLVAVDVARPKGKKLHFVEPTLVEARHLENGLGYLKVAMFPGMVGVEVANEITRAVEKLGRIDSLIIDLRGNTGGGIGALRVMSLLTPGRIPVGFALDRRRVTPNLDSEKSRFRRFNAIPASKKALWSLAFKVAPAMLAKTPIVLETEGFGKEGFPRTGDSPRGPPYGECR